MNYKMIFHTIGQILKVEAALLVLPLVVSLIYRENTYWAFLIPIALLLIIGFLCTIKKPAKDNIFAREGFVIVGLSWIIMSLFGALPFMISGEIPNFFDAIFETVSGFTTTGASVLSDVEALSKGMLFWRSFTHWIGGMGVLVFVLAVLPNSDGKSIYLLKAESPGPQVGKLVSKVRFTARILYCIYVVLTLIQIIFLVCGDMNFFDSVLHAFGTAGTGGFGIKNDSVAGYSAYSQIVIGIFMVIFGINFNIFYLALIGNIKQVFKNEELRWYIGIIVVATLLITFNVFYQYDYITSFGTTLRAAFFQVSSIITTTGFTTVDYDLWPALSKTILIFLMFIGASAGSTGGGLKVSRFIILIKSIGREIKNLLHPRSVTTIRFEGKSLDEGITKSVNVYFVTLITIFFACVLLVSFDGFSFETNFSAVAACLNNIGPGLGSVGPTANFGIYSYFSKVVLTLSMLIGRLEIFPILMLFSPRTYHNR